MDNMFIENKSRFDLDQTVLKLTEVISKSDWKLIHTHNLQQLMLGHGHEVLPAKVMEICAPQYANQLLSSDKERVYSNMMPCRLSIYEKSDGHTYVSRMNVEVFASSLGGVVSGVMSNAFQDAEKFIAHIVE